MSAALNEPGPFPPASRWASSEQVFQKTDAIAAAAAVSGSTEAKAAHTTESIQPVPVTRGMSALPPVTYQPRAPSVTMSSAPVRSTVQRRRFARAFAVPMRPAMRRESSGLHKSSQRRCVTPLVTLVKRSG